MHSARRRQPSGNQRQRPQKIPNTGVSYHLYHVCNFLYGQRGEGQPNCVRVEGTTKDTKQENTMWGSDT